MIIKIFSGNCYVLDLSLAPVLAWTAIQSLGVAIRRHAMASFGGFVYTIGGMTNDINQYDSAGDTWSVPTTTVDQVQQ